MTLQSRVCVLGTTVLAVFAVTARAQTTPQVAPAQSTSLCGGQPLCYENSAFAVFVTDFRTSTNSYWRIIDTTLHIVNKGSKTLILGFSDGSLMALDDQGNRYGMAGGPNGVRGIGVVRGNSADP